MRTIGDEVFEPRFQFGCGIGLYNSDRIEPLSARLLGKCGPDRDGFTQKSRSA
jgi:hypothetical protein